MIPKCECEHVAHQDSGCTCTDDLQKVETTYGPFLMCAKCRQLGHHEEWGAEEDYDWEAEQEAKAIKGEMKEGRPA